MNTKATTFFIGFSFLSVLALIVPISANAQTGPCTCDHKADLLNQLNRANAALNTIGQYMKTAKSTDMTDEIPSSPAGNKLTWKEMVEGAIYQAGYDMDNTDAHVMIIKLDSSSCKPTITAEGPCLKSIADKTAAELERVCLLEKKVRTAGGMNVPDYLRELSLAYQAETAEIIKSLKALEKKCKPYDWFGVITYLESTSENSVLDNGKTTVENSMTRSGRILVNGEPRPFSIWEVGGKYVYNKTGSSYSYCTPTDRRNDKRTPFTTVWRQEWDKAGSQPANIEVSIGEPEGNRVPVSFTLPPIKVVHNGGTTDIRQDGCPGAVVTIPLRSRPTSIMLRHRSIPLHHISKLILKNSADLRPRRSHQAP